MKPIILALTAFVCAAGLTACGSSTGDRAISGAGIGAGVGALGGLMLGAPLEGALIGGAVGAGTGALTKEKDINLGRPVWR
jgi:osmotically inducible lipoprotein OsmB